MMNVSDKNVQSVMNYYAKMGEDSKNKLFSQISDMKLQQMKLMNTIPTAKTKKKAVSGVLVTGATKSRDIKAYIATLRQKIDEIMMGDGDRTEKMSKANLLQMKINDLERIVSKQLQQETERQVKKRKKIKDRVYLTKDDLTLSGDGDGGADAGSPDSVGGNIDLSSGAGDILTDGGSGGESEIDIEA